MKLGLPDLGRRGEGWVLLQVVLLAAIVTCGVLGTGWPSAAGAVRLTLAAIVAAGGLYLFGSALAGLGRQLTPFPKPVEHGAVKRNGAYGLVRHPMYGGVLLLALAWALVSSPLALLPLALAAAFLDAKRRREEAWLLEVHPDYAAYRASVRGRLVPFVW